MVKELYTYTDYCKQCGTYRQKSSFFLKKEPSLHKNQFFSLIWGYAVFALHSVFEVLAEHDIRGYEKWDALIYSTKQPSVTVAQLVAPTIACPGFIPEDDLRRVTCTQCGFTKYYPRVRGVMRINSALVSGVDIEQTYEWFGDGHDPHREILVSNRFVRLALEQGWRGIRFKVWN
jgi:hypothetical protein